MRNTCSSVSLNEISTTVLMDEEGRDAPLKRATWHLTTFFQLRLNIIKLLAIKIKPSPY